jgi:hypothetical protein
MQSSKPGPGWRRIWPFLLAVIGAMVALFYWLVAVFAPCWNSDKQCLQRAQNASPVQDLDYWQTVFAKPVEQRFGPASPELVDYLILDNRKIDIPERPRAAALPPDFLRDVEEAMRELPPQVKRLVAAKLAGIYFVENMGGSGFTDQIGGTGAPPVGVTIYDFDVFKQRTANEWATWKENTPFKTQAGYRLSAIIENAPQDNRKNAFQYTLLHEIGHVIAIGGNIHPPWNIAPNQVKATGGYPFFELSWIAPPSTDGRNDVMTENRYLTVFDAAFPQRRNIVFYFGARLNGSDMLPVYDNLQHTNFATLYSTNGPFDDFAEAFANYVHVVLMKKPFEITIYRDGSVARVYKSCWDEARCLQKRQFIEQLLAPPPG